MIRQDLEPPTPRPGTEPVIGNLSPAELAEERSGPWLGREIETPAPAPPPAPRPDTETEERLLAQALGALIREGDPIRPTAIFSTGNSTGNSTSTGAGAGWPLGTAGGQPLPVLAPAGPADPWWDEPPRTKPPRAGGGAWPGFRRLLDLLGMTLAFLLIWTGYQAFLTLPETPTQSPWALLGSARQETPATPRGTQGTEPAKALPPIGQFDFGGTVVITDTPSALPAPALIRQEPVELYRSIYELEDAFEAKYVPPAGCAGLDTQAGVDITACINHRLNARRAFLASNGRTMEPDEPVRVRRPVAGTEMEGEEGWR